MEKSREELKKELAEANAKLEQYQHKAQLAYSFDIALQNELSLDENIALATELVVFIVHTKRPIETA